MVSAASRLGSRARRAETPAKRTTSRTVQGFVEEVCRLAAPPVVVSTGSSPRYQKAADAAVRAVLQGQPYTMLRDETYEQWKYMDIDFDPTKFRTKLPAASTAPTDQGDFLAAENSKLDAK